MLAEGIEVVSANLDNGLLHVDLRRPLPESRCEASRSARPGPRTAKAIDLDAGPAKKGEGK